MARTRFWNYNQDADSDVIIRWLLGALTPGRYVGFDAAAFQADMNLRLNHSTTGIRQTRTDASQTQTYTGVFMTKQGVMIQEDGTITIGISNGDATHPRYDLIIAQHEYVGTEDGDDVIYSTIEGTPAATPAIPSTTDKLTTVIGWLYVPAGTTALNGGGVIFTQADNPMSQNSKLETMLNVITSSLSYDDVLYRTSGGNWENQNAGIVVARNLIQMSKRLDQSYYSFNAGEPFSVASLTGGNLGLNLSPDYNFFEIYLSSATASSVDYIADIGRVGSIVRIYMRASSSQMIIGFNNATVIDGYVKIIGGSSDVSLDTGEYAEFIRTSDGWLFMQLDRRT